MREPPEKRDKKGGGSVSFDFPISPTDRKKDYFFWGSQYITKISYRVGRGGGLINYIQKYEGNEVSGIYSGKKLLGLSD